MGLLTVVSLHFYPQENYHLILGIMFTCFKKANTHGNTCNFQVYMKTLSCLWNFSCHLTPTFLFIEKLLYYFLINDLSASKIAEKKVIKVFFSLTAPKQPSHVMNIILLSLYIYMQIEARKKALIYFSWNRTYCMWY